MFYQTSSFLLSFLLFFFFDEIDWYEETVLIYIFFVTLNVYGLLLPRYQGTQAKSVNWVNERGGSKKLRGGG